MTAEFQAALAAALRKAVESGCGPLDLSKLRITERAVLEKFDGDKTPDSVPVARRTITTVSDGFGNVLERRDEDEDLLGGTSCH
jgi:hypothetical protein